MRQTKWNVPEITDRALGLINGSDDDCTSWEAFTTSVAKARIPKKGTVGRAKWPNWRWALMNCVNKELEKRNSSYRLIVIPCEGIYLVSAEESARVLAEKQVKKAGAVLSTGVQRFDTLAVADPMPEEARRRLQGNKRRFEHVRNELVAVYERVRSLPPEDKQKLLAALNAEEGDQMALSDS